MSTHSDKFGSAIRRLVQWRLVAIQLKDNWGHSTLRTYIHYLLSLVQMRPDWSLDELSSLLETNHFISAHLTTIHHELIRSGVSLKKLCVIAKEQNDDLCTDFVQQMCQYSADELGFLDEFSKDERTLIQQHGHSKKGRCTSVCGVFVHGYWVSGEGLLTLDGIVASTVIEGSMTCEKFLYFLEHSVISNRLQLHLRPEIPILTFYRCHWHHHILEHWV